MDTVRLSPHSMRTLGQAWISAHSPRVLLAEDDEEIRGTLAKALRRDGMEVVEARNGRELKDFVDSGWLREGRREMPDLIVSDLYMPEMSGLEVLAAVRQASVATPVILITAFGDEATRAEARRLGATAFFDKPFELADLETAIVNLVR
jgi:two-component system, response regulator, stage 0 sporulation protein F